MGIEETKFVIENERVTSIEQADILGLVITVQRRISYENAIVDDKTNFHVAFTRTDASETFLWDKTTAEGDSGGMTGSHVIATYEAAEHIEEHYATNYDRVNLSPLKR